MLVELEQARILGPIGFDHPNTATVLTSGYVYVTVELLELIMTQADIVSLYQWMKHPAFLAEPQKIGTIHLHIYPEI